MRPASLAAAHPRAGDAPAGRAGTSLRFELLDPRLERAHPRLQPRVRLRDRLRVADHEALLLRQIEERGLDRIEPLVRRDLLSERRAVRRPVTVDRAPVARVTSRLPRASAVPTAWWSRSPRAAGLSAPPPAGGPASCRGPAGSRRG